MKASRCGPAGMTLVEVLAALAVAAVVGVVGMRLLTGQLHVQRGLVTERLQERAAESVRGRLQLAWDRRCAHALQEGAWLELEGTVEGEELVLERLALKCFGAGGGLERLEWVREGGSWIERTRPWGATGGHWTVVPLGHSGEIRVAGGAGAYRGGSVPGTMRFRFPGSASRQLRQGFAIRAEW